MRLFLLSTGRQHIVSILEGFLPYRVQLPLGFLVYASEGEHFLFLIEIKDDLAEFLPS